MRTTRAHPPAKAGIPAIRGEAPPEEAQAPVGTAGRREGAKMAGAAVHAEEAPVLIQGEAAPTGLRTDPLKSGLR